MIRKIRFNNFYSMKDTCEVNFLTNRKSSYSYYDSDEGEQITKVAGFIGGNASGKTNFMRVFSFMSYFICESTKNSDPNILFKTFFNNDETSSFYIEFEIDKDIFKYEFSIKGHVILTEELKIKKRERYSREEVVFFRSKLKIENLNEKFFVDFPQKTLKNIRPDVSLISYVKANYNVKLINTVFNYFAKVQTNVSEQGDIDNIYNKLTSIQVYLGDEQLKKKMEDFIKKFDIGLNSIHIKQEKSENKRMSINISGVHKFKEKKYSLDFNYESRGTQMLFFTLARILKSLKDESVVIIDEIEYGFHPEALNKLIGYFIDENENGKAQLIFSSHSLGFMSILDMQQIFLVEKNDSCESLTYRLDEVEKVRPDENFLAKYMTGAYGAFPKIKI